MISWHGLILKSFEKFWENIRHFAFYNRTIFEIFFIFLYAIEQVALVWYTFNIKNLAHLGYVISIFAIIVLVTFALHKLIMESRIKLLEIEVAKLHTEKLSLESLAKEAHEFYNELYDKVVTQHLKVNTTSSKQSKEADNE